MAIFSPVVKNSFDFVFFLSIYQLRNRFEVVVPMLFGLVIGREKGSMEDIVNLPLASKV